jgi:hypothetical protein
MGLTIGSVLGVYDGKVGAVGEEQAPPTKQTVKAADVSERVRSREGRQKTRIAHI